MLIIDPYVPHKYFVTYICKKQSCGDQKQAQCKHGLSPHKEKYLFFVTSGQYFYPHMYPPKKKIQIEKKNNNKTKSHQT